MATWEKKPFRYVLVGLEQGSAAKPYEIVLCQDLRDNRRWVSCNCPSFTRGRQNKGLQQWERTCKHTQRGYTVDSPEIDFEVKNTVGAAREKQVPIVLSQRSRTVGIGALVYEGIGMTIAEPLIGSGGHARGPVLAEWVDEPEEGGRIPFQKPMLPARFEEGRDEKILNDPDWVATVKMDGHRALMVRQPYGKVEFFSRGGKRMMSVEPAFQDLGLAVGNMLDSELCVADINACKCPDRDSQREAFESVAHFRSEHPEALKLVVLDVLFISGANITVEPYWWRRVKASDIVRHLRDDRVEMVETKPNDISTEDWLMEINERGAEGVVFWNRNSPYRPGIRSSGDMIKKKWDLQTYDVVLLGTLPPSEKMDPTHRRMSYGWADGKVIGVAPISGPAKEMEALVGQVIEVEANALLPSGCLLYPRYVRNRPDKIPVECERP